MAKRLSRSRRLARGNGSAAARPAGGPAGRPAVVPATPEELAAQYSYVIRDLSRIGIIAVVLIGGLVALSFFLR